MSVSVSGDGVSGVRGRCGSGIGRGCGCGCGCGDRFVMVV